ncbi:hypothetical protein GE061_019939 [Apolygus lucorum]|uniref:Calpain catalytic domain-containing protein n=1 Tax=Apolygus lucorum TaxID=248454 RepID=A0A8S9XCG7_APOLU|nr:hypothetical protein GE061_019939 [Apolygus lucorum]
MKTDNLPKGGWRKSLFWQFGQWVTIVIDDRLPVNKSTNELIFIQSFRKEEFWSSIIEKAYAKFYGCYENLHGGRPSSGLLDLTGGISEWYQVKALPPNFHTRLLKYRNSNCILSCGIMGAANAVAEEKIDGNLLSKHAYSITDVKTVEYLSLRKDIVRHELMRIKNPWGSVEWEGAWSKNSPQWKSIPEKKRLSLGLKTDEDGEFWMSYQDFLLNFTDIYVCSVEPQMLGTKSDPGVRWASVSYLGEWNIDIPKTTNILHYSTIKFSQFQQFKIQLTDVDLYDSDNRCELVVALLQRSQRYHRQQGIAMLPIGYYIFLLERETEKLPLADKFFKHNKPVATSRMSDSQEVTCRYKFPPGCYVIIPVTCPTKKGEYLLRLCYEKRGNIWGHVILYNAGKTKHTALEDYGWHMSTTPKVYTTAPKRGSITSIAPYAIETGYEAHEPMPGIFPPRHLETSKHLSLEDSTMRVPKASPPKLLGSWSVKKSDNSCIEYQKKMSMAAYDPMEGHPFHIFHGMWDEKRLSFSSTPQSYRGSSLNSGRISKSLQDQELS